MRWKSLREPPIFNDALASKQHTAVKYNDTPDPTGCNTVAVEAISAARKAVYQGPHLVVSSKRDETKEVSSHSRADRDRRIVKRKLYQELSRYYRRRDGKWTSSDLLSRLKHGCF